MTEILNRITAGEKQAADNLLPLVYDELKKLANHRLATERAGHTLQSTALVHEAYLRLVGNPEKDAWDSKGHFFAAAAIAMRRILVDYARAKNSERRGSGDEIALGNIDHPAVQKTDQLVSMDEGLKELAELDPVKARLVELRFFAGCTNREAAEVLGISESTADRYWAYSRAWLKDYMQP